MPTLQLSIRPGFGRRLRAGSKRGLALFEIILALGIIGIVIGGAILLLQGAQERIKRNDSLSLINQVRAESSRVYAGRPAYTNLTMKLLCDRGSLPDDTIRSSSGCGTNASDYQHPYDGNIVITPIANKKQFWLQLADLDKGPCADILSSWAGKTRTSAGIRAAFVASANDNAGAAAAPTTIPQAQSSAITAGGSGWTSPFTDANASAMCAGDDNQNDVSILFQG